jgi:hypothetical protein
MTAATSNSPTAFRADVRNRFPVGVWGLLGEPGPVESGAEVEGGSGGSNEDEGVVVLVGLQRSAFGNGRGGRAVEEDSSSEVFPSWGINMVGAGWSPGGWSKERWDVIYTRLPKVSGSTKDVKCQVMSDPGLLFHTTRGLLVLRGMDWDLCLSNYSDV